MSRIYKTKDGTHDFYVNGSKVGSFVNASATESGVVNTGAQTLAGAKTLDGGAKIKGATSAIAAGYVGEVISSSYVRTFSGSTGWLDITPISTALSLPAGGTWIIIINYIFPTGASVSGNYLTLVTSSTGDNSSNIIFNQIGTPVLGTTSVGGANFIRTEVITGNSAVSLYVKIYPSSALTATINVDIKAIRIA